MHLLVTGQAINLGEDLLCREPSVAGWLLATGQFTHLYICEDLGEDHDGKPRQSGLTLLEWAQSAGCMPEFVQVISEGKERNISSFLFNQNRTYEKGFWVLDSTQKNLGEGN